MATQQHQHSTSASLKKITVRMGGSVSTDLDIVIYERGVINNDRKDRYRRLGNNSYKIVKAVCIMAKIKRMTNKEFKEIFNKYYGNFDNWGYEGVLTILALNSYREAKDYKAKGLENSYRASIESADAIADELRSRKYFA